MTKKTTNSAETTSDADPDNQVFKYITNGLREMSKKYISFEISTKADKYKNEVLHKLRIENVRFFFR